MLRAIVNLKHTNRYYSMFLLEEAWHVARCLTNKLYYEFLRPVLESDRTNVDNSILCKRTRAASWRQDLLMSATSLRVNGKQRLMLTVTVCSLFPHSCFGIPMKGLTDYAVICPTFLHKHTYVVCNVSACLTKLCSYISANGVKTVQHNLFMEDVSLFFRVQKILAPS